MTITNPGGTPQSDERPDSLTRAQVLAARGYEPETLAEHRPAGLVVFDGGTAPARSCPVCAGPVPAGRKVTCSSSCAEKHRQRDSRERSAARVQVAGTGNHPDPPGSGAPAATREEPPPAVAPDGRISGAVALADELEEAAGLLRRIAGRLSG